MSDWLIENSLTAAVLALVVMASGRMFRLPPAVRHAFWLVVMIKLVTPPLFGWAAIAPTPRQGVAAIYAEHVEPVLLRFAPADSAAGPIAPIAESVPAESPAVPQPFDWRTTLLTLWALGSVVFLAIVIRRFAALRRATNRATRAPAWLQQECTRLAEQMRVSAPRLLCVPGLSAPCTGGLFRASVFWPESWTANDERAHAVLAHELAHVRRRDHLVAVFEVLAGIAWWWNPLFWFVRGRVRECAEQSADAWALQVRPVSARRYAETLIELRSGGVRTIGALSAGGSGKRELARRLRLVFAGVRRAGLSGSSRVMAFGLLVMVLPSWSVGPSGSSGEQQDPKRESRAAVPPAEEVQDPERPGPTVPTDRSIASVAHVPASGRLVMLELDEEAMAYVGWRLEHAASGVELEIVQQDARSLVARVQAGQASSLTVGDRVTPTAFRALLACRASVLPGGRLRLLMEAPIECHPVAKERVALINNGKVVYESAIDRIDGAILHLAGRPLRSLRGETVEVRLISRTPLKAVQHVGLGKPLPRVSGDVTWICDYSDNRLIAFDKDGSERFAIEEVYGIWDAEVLATGNLLITEFALNRVVEVDSSGDQVWAFSDLRNPYEADRLPNGNTLIADTFGSRVVEVSPEGKEVWEFAGEDGEGIRPYDVERLANGNTLISDGQNDRVIEIDREHRLVWEVSGVANPHDADRLPNGNTLITQRTLHRVIEVDKDGNIIAILKGLASPSDADRLPNGHTIVAENGQVREFDAAGKICRKIETSWAVEVNVGPAPKKHD